MPAAETAPIVCSGTSGFIGSHLAAALLRNGQMVVGIDRVPAPPSAAYREIRCDIHHLGPLCAAAGGLTSQRLIHLAAEAEVITPWEQIPSVFLSNLNGTWNLLSAFSPRLCLFASSSSVYGNTESGTSGPLGIYGATKHAGELLLRDWALATDAAAVLFRFGNVIGPRCRGLIPYLVQHALRYPEGSVPAQMRGGGKLVRDYVPVDYVIRILDAAAESSWESGVVRSFDVGTGRGLTNGEVAAMVQRTLLGRGIRLEIDCDHPVPAGEAHSVRLNVGGLQNRFGIAAPAPEAVEASIEESVLSHLSA
jgi:nucleoside-diphosphate-sugar epimerase